jgi:hypothetical protein
METNRNARIFIAILILIIIGLVINTCDGRKGVVPSEALEEKLITIEEARVLEQEYLTTRYDTLNKILGYEDNREFNLPLEFLEEYIAYVKSEGKKKGYNNMGIRVYNAAYPEDSDDKRTQPGFSTIVLVPTYEAPAVGQGFLPMPPPPPRNARGVSAANYINGGKDKL